MRNRVHRKALANFEPTGKIEAMKLLEHSQSPFRPLCDPEFDAGLDRRPDSYVWIEIYPTGIIGANRFFAAESARGRVVAGGDVLGRSALRQSALRAVLLVLVLSLRFGIGRDLGDVQLQSLFAGGLCRYGGGRFSHARDPDAAISFLYGSIFLAFAYLYPNFTICIMFVLPVKVKWLAMGQWLLYGLFMLSGYWVVWIQSDCLGMQFFDIFQS